MGCLAQACAVTFKGNLELGGLSRWYTGLAQNELMQAWKELNATKGAVKSAGRDRVGDRAGGSGVLCFVSGRIQDFFEKVFLRTYSGAHGYRSLKGL